MSTINEKMTAIADEIRELSGITNPMGLDAMAAHVGDANDEVDTQANLIAQIRSTLENKAAGGGSSSGSVETCTISLMVINGSTFYYINAKNELSTTSNGMVTISDISANSICVAVAGNGGFSYVTQSGNCTLITSTNTIRVYHITGDCQIAAAGISGSAN